MIKDKRSAFTPPQLGRLWGVSGNKIREWIESYKLSAVNFSEGDIRPRYRVSWEDAERFWKSRMVASPDVGESEVNVETVVEVEAETVAPLRPIKRERPDLV